MRAALLLLAALGAVAWFWWGKAPGWRREDAWTRAATYQRLLLKTGLAFLLPGLIGLALLGRLDALWRMPLEFAPVSAVAPTIDGVPMLLAGLAAGAAVGQVLAWRAVRRGRRPFTLGDYETLVPQSRAELPWGVALSVMAGVAEELFHRLLLPLLLTLVTGSAGLAVTLSVALFAGLHRYQGWAGVAATGFVGALMTAVYLGTGALWAAMLLHTLIDLNGLVLRPLVSGALRGR